MATRPASITTDRHLGIGASDAKRIVDGDWHALWQEKMGEAEPVDLSRNFPVQLGSFTENFHLDWLETREGWTIGQRNMLYVHDGEPFMRAHIDGEVDKTDLPIEVKHSNSRANAREKAHYYMPQLQHIIEVMGVDAIHFSVIAGNTEPELILVERNPAFIEDLVELERSFWWHVTEAIAPDITPTGKQAALKLVGAQTVIDGLKPYDMTGNNEWASHATDYTETAEAAARFETAKKAMKQLVPADASACTGHGVTIKRDKRGSLRFYTGE